MNPEFKILLVDDDPFILNAFQRALRKHFTIEICSSGPEGLKSIGENGPYAVVVSDLNMPGMDGIEFLEEVRRISPDTVRILCSGSEDEYPDGKIPDNGLVFRDLNKVDSNSELVNAINEGLQLYQSRQ